MKTTRSGILVQLFSVFLVLAVVSCGSGEGAAAQDRAEAEKEIQKLAQSSAAFNQLFSKTIKYVMPSVVSISTTHTQTASFGPSGRLPWPGPFHPSPRPQMRPRPREFKSHGLGSGFVIDAKQGYVVTNNHVVKGIEDAKDIKLTFHDGREVIAKEVLRDPKTDVALIKIEPKDLVALEWGGRDDIKAGNWVIAFGSPMGFGNSATAGIISAESTKDRVFGGGRRHDFQPRVRENPYAVEDYIQTDAAINRGNSGGPLVTLTGKVIGVNTLIVSPTGASAGLGFAAPESIVRPVVEELIKRGRVIRGHLGVSIMDPADISDEAAWGLFGARNADEVFNEFHIKRDDKGVVVAGVLPGTPADEAGIERGDLMLAVGETKTPDSDALREIIAALKPATKVKISLVRKGRKMTLPVTIGEQPSERVALARSGDLGLSVQTLTPAVAKALGYKEGLEGVVVTDVARGSPAEKAGVKRNDIIVQVNRKEVGSVEEFKAHVRSAGPDGVALLVKRGDSTKFIAVKP